MKPNRLALLEKSNKQLIQESIAQKGVIVGLVRQRNELALHPDSEFATAIRKEVSEQIELWEPKEDAKVIEMNPA